MVRLVLHLVVLLARLQIYSKGLAKVWTNGDGSGTVGITDSLNTASMTDEGTGDYTYNFTNNMGTTYIVQGVATGG